MTSIDTTTAALFTTFGEPLSGALADAFSKPLLLVQLAFIKDVLPRISHNEALKIAALPLDAMVARLTELKAARAARAARAAQRAS